MSTDREEVTRQAELAKLRAELAAAEARAALAKAEAQAALARAEAEAAIAQADAQAALARAESTALLGDAAPTEAPPIRASIPSPPPPPLAASPAPARPAPRAAPPVRKAESIESPVVVETVALQTGKDERSETKAKSNPGQKEPTAKATGSDDVDKPKAKRSWFGRGAKAEQQRDKTSPTDKSEGGEVPKSRGKSMKAGTTKDEPEDQDDEAPVGRWGLNPNLARFTTASSVSMVVHMVVLILLGLVIIPGIEKPVDKIIVASLDQTPEDIVNQVLEEPINAATSLNFSTSTAAVQAGNLGSMDSPENVKLATTETTQTTAPTTMAIADVASLGKRGQTVLNAVPIGSMGEPSAVVENYDQAMDRITQEILLNLTRGKVLVMWCFDQSESMKDDRAEINKRIDRVYAELGITSAAQGDHLLTSVCSYGKGWLRHTPVATSDIDKIRAAMDEVPVDDSGMEIMCQAVGQTIASHRAYAGKGQRIMMLILVTDESGDERNNYDYLESTILEAKADRCAIYTLGREAVFGYPWAHMWWTWKQPAVGGGTVQNSALLQVDRGPESPFVEQLQTAGLMQRRDAHPSGFGPYEQVRMSRETGGVFFMLPSPEIHLFQRDNRKYALEIMRPYLPDLRSRDQYSVDRDKSALRTTIWKVINDLNPWKPEIGKYINMRHDFTADPAAFARQVSSENQKAKQYFLYLHAAEKAMEELEASRNKEQSPRWQANYDLIHAQIVAYKVRLYEYGAYLEAFVKQPKPVALPLPNKVQHGWDLRERTKTLTDATTGDYMRKARAMFEDIKRYHEGTPWAARAELELKRGFGVELMPDFHDPTYRPRQPVGGWKVPKL